MFTKTSKAVIYWLQIQTAQHMLDFDFLSDRTPSVFCFINPWKNTSSIKLFYGKKEILVPVYNSFSDILIDENIDTFVNFSSFRSAYSSTVEAMKSKLFKNIIIIAEWIPERQTREIIELNKIYKLNIIGPATVWAMNAWIFRAWNTWWSLENIVTSKLYTPWSVWFVSKSWWMSNELRRIIADNTNGTNLSIALWWDKYNIMQFKDVFKIMQNDENIKMIVMLWEVWWIDELEIAQMIENKEITKPVVAFCIWTIWELISKEVQFGHAWAKSNKEQETATYKNNYLKKSWAIVPDSFIDFWIKIKEVFEILNPNLNLDNKKQTKTFWWKILEMLWDNLKTKKVEENIIIKDEIPEYIKEKLEIIKNRIPTKFTSTIVDERWEELLYNKKPISSYIEKWSFANVIWNLWLKRDLPDYALVFINTTLIILADHGPAVSWATNAIITARAWNSLKSSLIAGLSTIWPRFGWAIDGAARWFFSWVNKWLSPQEFVDMMKKSWENIPGIWHKVKSKFNPDKRCKILLEKSCDIQSKKYLNFALEVEKITLEKRANLILNVDWIIAACFLDIFESIWMNKEEINEYIEAWIFNAFFILARTTWFIWHIIDQKRLKEWLYRTSWDDILYE